MTPSQGLLDVKGSTFNPLLDYDRLADQLSHVAQVVADGNWHTIPEIEQEAFRRFNRFHSQSGISARLRQLRNEFGCTVERKRIAGGLFTYRVSWS